MVNTGWKKTLEDAEDALKVTKAFFFRLVTLKCSSLSPTETKVSRVTEYIPSKMRPFTQWDIDASCVFLSNRQSLARFGLCEGLDKCEILQVIKGL